MSMGIHSAMNKSAARLVAAIRSEYMVYLFITCGLGFVPEGSVCYPQAPVLRHAEARALCTRSARRR